LLLDESVKVLELDVSFVTAPAPVIAPDKVCATEEEYSKIAPDATAMAPE
jgi:hypothetical protein